MTSFFHPAGQVFNPVLYLTAQTVGKAASYVSSGVSDFVEHYIVSSQNQELLYESGRALLSQATEWLQDHPVKGIAFSLFVGACGAYLVHAFNGPLANHPLTPILDTWANAPDQSPEENRLEAKRKILEFVRDRTSDSLNLDALNLSSLPEEVFSSPFFPSQRLEVLNLSHNQLQALPPQIEHLENLEELDLSHNQLEALPTEIGNLESLEGLDLSHNQLQTLPPQIENLESLERLYLSHNQFQVLPPQIGNLTRLEELGLGRNQLQALPAEIGNLENLKYLELFSNQLQELPSEIGSLTRLEHLGLSLNELQALPAEIGNLRDLTHFNLSFNQLQTLTPEIGNLRNLTRLDLKYNQLDALPGEIRNLQNLVYLNLLQNQLAVDPRIQPGLPPSITDLSLEQNPFLAPAPAGGGAPAPLPSIEQLLTSIASHTSQPLAADLLSWATALPENHRDILQAWLERLDDIKEFHPDHGTSPEAKQKLATHILSLLEKARSDESYRTSFFTILEMTNIETTCGDGIALSVVDLSLAAAETPTLDWTDGVQVIKHLKNEWKIKVLRKLADRKLASLPEDYPEPVEVHLAYITQRAEALGLEVPIGDMIYFEHHAQTTSAELDQAVEIIKLLEKGEVKGIEKKLPEALRAGKRVDTFTEQDTFAGFLLPGPEKAAHRHWLTHIRLNPAAEKFHKAEEEFQQAKIEFRKACLAEVKEDENSPISFESTLEMAQEKYNEAKAKVDQVLIEVTRELIEG